MQSAQGRQEYALPAKQAPTCRLTIAPAWLPHSSLSNFPPEGKEMKTTGPPIKNPESIDFPSSYRKEGSHRSFRLPRPHPPHTQRALRRPQRAGSRNRTVGAILMWILVAVVFLAIYNLVYKVGNETAPQNVARRLEARNVIQPTPSYSTQDMYLTMKIVLKSKLRDEGARRGECGMFRCSKRWNGYMDAEIVRIIGR